VLRLHDQCTADNPDCNWQGRVAGPQPDFAVTSEGRIAPLNGHFDLPLDNLRNLYALTKVRTGTMAPGLPLRNSAIVSAALDEAQLGLCGSAARSRYNTGSGEWCSEFAVWVVHRGFSGFVEPLRHTSNGGFTTDEVCSQFARQDRRFIDDSVVSPSGVTNGVQPGDFLALHGGSGDDRGHAGVAVGVSQDKEVIWTVEGNRGDCVVYDRRSYFPGGGALDAAVDGVGKVSESYAFCSPSSSCP